MYTSTLWPNTIGPTIGQRWKLAGKTALNWCRAGFWPRLKSFPRYDDRPAAPAKIVSASPETIWLARSVITRKAGIEAAAAPASAAPPHWAARGPPVGASGRRAGHDSVHA